MSDPLVRDDDERQSHAPQLQASAHRRDAETAPGAVPGAALAQPRQRSFAEVLASMPNVGMDADFERVNARTKMAHRRHRTGPRPDRGDPEHG